MRADGSSRTKALSQGLKAHIQNNSLRPRLDVCFEARILQLVLSLPNTTILMASELRCGNESQYQPILRNTTMPLK